ncbi:hypothetical protein [Halosimplex salinum]|uniref:hypothetical protein n=1 Tax=Halosimplex salinum TaxID=1710538 RepID=UPI000F490B6F|nr:hypothetical protein [Halosimplex salinum]
MARLGGERGLGPALDRQTLRIVGFVTIACTSAVTALSLGTPHGLSIPGRSASNTATVVADIGAAAAVVEFAAAHPAYPTVAVIGFVLIVAGEDTPLLGN